MVSYSWNSNTTSDSASSLCGESGGLVGRIAFTLFLRAKVWVRIALVAASPRSLFLWPPYMKDERTAPTSLLWGHNLIYTESRSCRSTVLHNQGILWSLWNYKTLTLPSRENLLIIYIHEWRHETKIWPESALYISIKVVHWCRILWC